MASPMRRVVIERTEDGRIAWRDTNDGYCQIPLVRMTTDPSAPGGVRTMRGELCMELPNGAPTEADIEAVVRQQYAQDEVV